MEKLRGPTQLGRVFGGEVWMVAVSVWKEGVEKAAHSPHTRPRALG